MFEIGDEVWYRGPGRHDTPPIPAVITGYRRRRYFATDILTCRCEGALFDSQGRLYNFESRECTLCGEPTDVPGCPLCPNCIEEQREQEQGLRAEMEQKRRPR